MARIITKELAEKIAKKLGATLVKSRAHTIAQVFHEGTLIVSFGIRHGSEKDQGHDHIPADIHIGPGKTKRLGQCPMSRDEWIECLREKGLIPNPPEPRQTETGA